MSHTSESYPEPAKEVDHADLSEEDDPECTTLPQQADTDKQGETTEQFSQAQFDTDNEQQLRRSQRTRTFTEKGKALLDDKLRNLNASFVKL